MSLRRMQPYREYIRPHAIAQFTAPSLPYIFSVGGTFMAPSAACAGCRPLVIAAMQTYQPAE